MTASPSLTKKKAKRVLCVNPASLTQPPPRAKSWYLEAPKAPTEPLSMAAPLASVLGSSKKAQASLSDDASDHEDASAKTHFDSTESSDVLAPKKKNKRWFQVSSSQKSLRSKGSHPSNSTPKASSLMGSTPLSKFWTKVKKIPPPCSSSESDSSEAFEPSNLDPLEDGASIEDDVESEAESDPSDDPSVSPKGKKAMKIPKICTKSPVVPKATTGSSFKAHSLNLCFNDNETNMKHYVHRDVICEKKISFSAHRVFGVIKNIEDKWWLGSLTRFDGFVPRAFQEFYANLNDELFDSKSFMFGHVYVRGHWYLFSAVEIAKVLNVPSVVTNDAVDFNKDKVLSELVGHNMVWEQHLVLKVTDLTHYYVMRHKFSINHWIPTTHNSTITLDTAFFLFIVGTGLQVDLATLIFYQIIALGNAEKKGQYLVFSHLIYKFLDSQKPLRLEYEIVIPPTAGVDYKLNKESLSSKMNKGIVLKVDDADSVITELAGAKTTLETIQTEVHNLQNCLSTIKQLQRTMTSQFAAGPSK
ncbi:uncharacterized protein LOC133814731 [Humulus lupulus]|uniref:uncharacterized protein LOC133814731 n=1 Tax=Humulus lupulus TaxID=3486 RepID=UPI002B40D639|nr:uncharacterized protein LOC133814731 [Humulus lupulus]